MTAVLFHHSLMSCLAMRHLNPLAQEVGVVLNLLSKKRSRTLNEVEQRAAIASGLNLAATVTSSQFPTLNSLALTGLAAS